MIKINSKYLVLYNLLMRFQQFGLPRNFLQPHCEYMKIQIDRFVRMPGRNICPF